MTSFNKGPVISVSPGGLAKIAGALLKEKINIEYAYAFVSRKEDKAYVVLRTDDLGKTQKVLEKSGIRIVSDKEIEGICYPNQAPPKPLIGTQKEDMC